MMSHGKRHLLRAYKENSDVSWQAPSGEILQGKKIVMSHGKRHLVRADRENSDVSGLVAMLKKNIFFMTCHVYHVVIWSSMLSEVRYTDDSSKI